MPRLLSSYLFFLLAFFTFATQNLLATTIALASSANPATYGKPVTLTATVSTGASGKVTFYDGTTILGVSTISGTTATLTTIGLPTGSRSLRAYYWGDGGSNPPAKSESISQTVAARPSPGFRGASSYQTGAAGTNSIAVSDLNGDLKPDLVVGNLNASSISILLGKGDGTFQTPTKYPAGAGQGSIVTGDWDADGRIDLALANNSAGTISTMLGNGDGTFRAATPIQVGGLPGPIAVADFNEDGKADLGVGASGAMAILFGNGDGTFRAANFIDGVFLTTSFAVGDLNRDGHADLVFGVDHSTLLVAFGRGDGTFNPPVSFITDGSSRKVAVDDLNRDGKQDLIWLDTVYSALAVKLGNGDGTLQASISSYVPSLQPRDFVVSDWNGDGFPDALVSFQGLNSFATVTGNGEGLLNNPTFYGFPDFLTGLSLAEFNGDGLVDAVTVHQSGDVLFWFGGPIPDLTIKLKGSGFTQGQSGDYYRMWVTNSGNLVTSGPVTVTAAIPAGFTATAIAGTGWSCSLTALSCTRTDLLNPGLSYPSIRVSVTPGNQTGSVTAIASVSGGNDGNPSNNSASETSNVHFVNTISLTSSPNPSTLGQAVTLTATVGNGSGRVAFYDGLTLLGYAALSSGQASLITTALPNGARNITARFTGDSTYGRVLSAVRIQNVGALAVNGSIAMPLISIPSGVSRLASGDFNGDGKPDLVVAGVGVKVLINNGNGAFQAPVSYALRSSVVDLAVCDVNADGKLDLIVKNLLGYTTTFEVLLGNGDGSLRDPVAFGDTNQDLFDFVVADFNSDGFVDILTLGRLEVFLGHGDGTFENPLKEIDLSTFGQRRGFPKLADLDNDGKVDLILDGDPDTRTLFVMLGIGDGTFQRPVSFSTVYARPSALIPGDFNADGKVDVVERFDSDYVIFKGNGDGTLQSPRVAVSRFSQTLALYSIAADFTGEGNLDIAIRSVSDPGVLLLFGSGDGTFATSAMAPTDGANGNIVAADFNGDGRMDFAVANTDSVNVFLGAQVSGLTATSAHSGSFVAGGVGSYQVTVRNPSYNPTSGVITVTAAPPFGLTIQSMSGDGWACVGSTCTRADRLSYWNVFPVISATVSVSLTLPPATVNTRFSVTSSGTTNTTLDPTNIVASLPVPVYRGFVDAFSCAAGITGWAADRNRLNQSINVTLWDGATQIASALANAPRGDVGYFLGDSGLHGFTIPIPSAYADGVSRSLQVRFETTTTQLSLSPVTIKCGGTTTTPSYAGFVDAASCNGGITGWAADRNRKSQSINVTLWDGNTQIASVLANGSRGDVGAVLGDNGLHGYSIPIPSAYANGTSRTYQVRYETSTTQLPSSPVTLKCGTPAGGGGNPNYIGYVDSVSCRFGIIGWAADRNRPNQPINVTLWDRNTQLASVLAYGERGDVGWLLGDNGLHGFTIPIPAGLGFRISRTMQVRYETSTAELISSPVTFECDSPTGGTTTDYAGWADSISCSAISGWAADKNRLNQLMSVDLVEGGSFITTVLANISRPDVGAVLGDNGVHGFSFAPPSPLKDGAAHNIQLRYSGTTTPLPNSTQTLQCPNSGGGGTTTPNFTGYVDQVGCSVISGWAADRSRPGVPIDVQIFDGATLLGTITANLSRPDVGAVVGDNGVHGFGFTTPQSVKDGRAHTITVKPAGSGTIAPLQGPQSLTCP